MEKTKVCKYFQNGKCRKDNCPFLHRKEFKPACRFFRAGHCKFGEECEFYHQVKKVEQPKPKPYQQRQNPVQIKPRYQEKEKEESKAESDADREKRQAINKLLGFHQKPEKKEEEPKVNINFNKKIIINFIDLSKSPQGKENIARIDLEIFKEKPFLEYLKQLAEGIERQRGQVIRRYQYSFRSKVEDRSQYSLSLSPVTPGREMKLNFPIEERCLHLDIIHCDKIKSICIVNESIPKHFKEGLNIKIACQLETKGVYETLKYIENNFEKICEQVDFLLENRQAPKIQYSEGIEVVEREKEREKGLEKGNNSDEEEEEGNKLKKEREIVPDIELPTLIVAQKIALTCEILLVEDILLHLNCDCSNEIAYVLRSKQRRGLTIKARIRCPKCKEVITLYMARLMVDKSGEDISLGKIGMIGAKLQDIGGVSWKILCECENNIYTEEMTLSGVRKQANCFTCFKQFNIQYFGIYKINPLIGEIAKKPAYKFDKGGQVNFKLDTELPNKGTCKHSKFSFRFFRYPCCGRAFPCERCHEQRTDSHKMEQRADVMICGYCSCEQPLSNVCKRCKKELVKGSQKSGHWQGGAGCRDKALLSRNDAKKYTGLNKTTANKR